MRDDFSEGVKRIIAARVAYLCSNEMCRVFTVGPQIDPSKHLNIGVAAHITAASPGGPRYNPSLTPQERRSHNNAIWLCQTCAKLIDNDQVRFTEVIILEWKQTAESQALARIGRAAAMAYPTRSVNMQFSDEQLVILSRCTERGDILLLTSDELGEFVQIGEERFYDETDQAVAALYVDALISMCDMGLVRHQEGILYHLTGRGFRIARALGQLTPDQIKADEF